MNNNTSSGSSRDWFGEIAAGVSSEYVAARRGFLVDGGTRGGENWVGGQGPAATAAANRITYARRKAGVGDSIPRSTIRAQRPRACRQLTSIAVDCLHPNPARVSVAKQPLSRIELLQGTLDFIILQTLRWGPRHGYGIAQMIRANTGDTLQVDT